MAWRNLRDISRLREAAGIMMLGCWELGSGGSWNAGLDNSLEREGFWRVQPGKAKGRDDRGRPQPPPRDFPLNVLRRWCSWSCLRQVGLTWSQGRRKGGFSSCFGSCSCSWLWSFSWALQSPGSLLSAPPPPHSRSLQSLFLFPARTFLKIQSSYFLPF